MHKLKLRVSGGLYKNRQLTVSKAARPLMEKTKNAVFSILGDKIKGATILDLFAGSGNLGIEALSRGASECILVDDDFFSVKAITENLSTIAVDESKYEIVKSDGVKFIVNDARHNDIIFVDPPYDVSIHHILKFIDRVLEDKGIILYFTSKKTEFDEELLKRLNKNLKIYDKRDYGITRVHFISKKHP